jgi:hypothetical protein
MSFLCVFSTQVAILRDEEEREVCRLSMDADNYSQLVRADPTAPSPDFGLKYRFVLTEGTSEGAKVGRVGVVVEDDDEDDDEDDGRQVLLAPTLDSSTASC